MIDRPSYGVPLSERDGDLTCRRGGPGEDKGIPRRPAIESLTSLRGLAALWVVVFHFLPDIVTLLPPADLFSPALSQGHFAVPIFFVLSGYVLAHNYLESIGARADRSKLFRFWSRRLARIYPLHLATLLAVLAMVISARLLGLTISEEGYGWRDFVLNLLLIHTWVPHFRLNWNYPSWSISSEWFAYLLFPAACLALFRIRRTAILVALVLSVYALWVGLILAADRLPFREMISVVCPFLLGCTFSRAVTLGFSPRFGLGIASWVLASALALLPYLVTGRALPIAMATTGAALVFVLGAAGTGCPRFWLWRPLIVLGEVSYSLYLVHTLVQKLAYEIAPAARFAGGSLAIRLSVLGGYAIGIAVATWIAYVGIDDHFRKSLRGRMHLRTKSMSREPDEVMGTIR